MQAAAETGDEGAVYNIGTAARKSGLSVTTIRTWEDRYGAVVPVRDASGRRLYSSDQISQLTWLRQQIDAGLRASEAHRLLMSGETEPMSPTGVVVDQGSPWATLLVWSEQEKDWVGSVLTDLRKGLRASATAIAAVIDNPVRGRLLSITNLDDEVGETGRFRPLGLVELDAVSGLAGALEDGQTATRTGNDFGLDEKDVVLAPLTLSGTLAGVIMSVGPEVSEPGSLVDKAVRVIESRIEADRARSAFSNILD